MPAPVESAVKRMHPMRSNAPHERYSPKPTRKSGVANKKPNLSSPSTPTSEMSPRSPFFVVARNSVEESASMPPMGATSMWIPASASNGYFSLSRKVLQRRQSNGGSGEMILPSKADLGDD